MSQQITAGLGGKINISDLDCCATRLRVTVNDSAKVKEGILKATGAVGVMRKGNGVQIVYGPKVNIIKSKLEEYLKTNKADIAAITVPKARAASIASDLAEWGVRGIWNFAPTDLNVPKEVTVENVHLAESLMKLSYKLSGNDTI